MQFTTAFISDTVYSLTQSYFIWIFIMCVTVVQLGHEIYSDELKTNTDVFQSEC
jgi:hypothetical protein